MNERISSDEVTPGYKGLMTLFEQIREGACILDADGRVIEINQTLLRMSGYDRVEVIGQSMESLIRSVEQAAGFAELQRQLSEKGTAHLETEARRRDDVDIYVEIRAYRTLHDGAPAVVVLFRDISERRRTAAELRASRDRLAGLVRYTPLGIIAWDTDFRVTEWNPAAEKIFGFSRDEALGRSSALIVPEDVREYVADKWRGLMSGEGGLRGTNENCTRDGRIILCEWYNSPLLDDDGRVIGVMSMIEDVTEERELIRERNRLLSAIDQSDDAFVITDADGAIRYVNSAFEAVSGYSRDEVLGRDPSLLRSGLHPSAFYDVMWKTISSGETWRGDIVNRRKDGGLFTEQMTISPVLDEQGAIGGYVSVRRDVTVTRSTEAMLQQSQKMESIGRLAGGVAHDFNNMLNVILGYTEMIMQDLDQGDPIKADLEEVHKAALHSADLTRQLLAFSRKQIVEPKIVELNAVIDPMRKTIARLIGEDVQLEFRPGDDLWKVRIDPAQVDQLLANLCVNARDAMPGGGRLDIETANCDVDREAASVHAEAKPGPHVVLSVSDNGAGISNEALPYLFEPFYTTKGEGEGTGLGLSTVQGIVRQNGGFVIVESETGRGTTFRIHLPRCEASSIETSQTTDTEIEPEGFTGRVLLVEDDDMLRELIRSKLKQVGFEVTSAERPSQALELNEAADGPFDLLLTDVVMPEMNGKQLSDRLRVGQPDLRILFMSGYTSDVISHQGILDEGLNFLPKPFSLEALIAKIRQAMSG